MSFGDRLRAARERNGYTQQQVADQLGLDKSTYCGYETGKRHPDVPKIKRLSQILGASADDLLETGYKKNPPSEKEDESVLATRQMLLDTFQNVDENTARSIIDLAESLKKLREK